MSTTIHPISENPRLRIRRLVTLLVTQQRLAAGIAAEARHQLDNSDTAFARLACEHPDRCSCTSDYPDWTPGGGAR